MRPELRQRSRIALGDAELQGNLQRALRHSLERRAELVADNPRWPLLREQARDCREYALNHIAELRAQLTRQVQAHGGQVSVCADADDARRTVLEILRRADARLVVKGKSMVSEELELNAALEAADIEVWEGDLGELIVQLKQEPPAHITAPALHLNRRQIGALFHRVLGVPRSDDPVTLTGYARAFLQARFRSADAGITGANFVVAESGSVVLVENECNIRLATTLPRLHIAITGIEKVVPKLTDLAPLLTLLPASATGQKASAAVSLLGGPRAAGEVDGPREFHLILVDNGRSSLLADPTLRAALRCIRCGACLNVCPIFQRIGGHGYGSVYPGPIGVLLSRALLGDDDDAHACACSLCGACAQICPVQIPLPQLILEVRRRCQRARGMTGERFAHRAFAAAARRPRLFNGGLHALVQLASQLPASLSTALTEAWSGQRALPRPQPPTAPPSRSRR